MIEKLDSKMDCVEITVLGKHTKCLGFDSAKEIGKKLNELVDAVNGILDYAPLEMAMKTGPKTPAETVQQVSYTAPGDITVFHGFNCSVEFDTPLPKGTRITIKTITKGGKDE